MAWVTLCDPYPSAPPFTRVSIQNGWLELTRRFCTDQDGSGFFPHHVTWNNGLVHNRKKGRGGSWSWCWVDSAERTRVRPQHVVLDIYNFLSFYFTWRATTKGHNCPLEVKVLQLVSNRLRLVPKPPVSQEWFTLTIYFHVYYSLEVLHYCLNWFTCKQWRTNWMCLRNESFRNCY